MVVDWLQYKQNCSIFQEKSRLNFQLRVCACSCCFTPGPYKNMNEDDDNDNDDNDNDNDDNNDDDDDDDDDEENHEIMITSYHFLTVFFVLPISSVFPPLLSFLLPFFSSL